MLILKSQQFLCLSMEHQFSEGLLGPRPLLAVGGRRDQMGLAHCLQGARIWVGGQIINK